MAVSVVIGEILTPSAIVAAAYATFAAPRHKLRVKVPTPEAAVWASTLAYFLIFSAPTLARHYGTSTHGLDLRHYAGAVYQFGPGRLFRRSQLPNEVFVNRSAPLLAAHLCVPRPGIFTAAPNAFSRRGRSSGLFYRQAGKRFALARE